jgi:flagellin-like protein
LRRQPSGRSRRSGRPGVSEILASLLMVGVTVALGGLVAAAAAGQLSSAAGSASLGASLQESSDGAQVSLVYAVAASPGSCPTYGGVQEGTSLTFALFDYGTASFGPAAVLVNSTLYSGAYAQLSAGALGVYTISLGACAHPSGQTLLMAAADGKEVQFET